MASSLGIDYAKLTAGAIIGTAILYDVKEYKRNSDFEKDKNKHYAGPTINCIFARTIILDIYVVPYHLCQFVECLRKGLLRRIDD